VSPHRRALLMLLPAGAIARAAAGPGPAPTPGSRPASAPGTDPVRAAPAAAAADPGDEPVRRGRLLVFPRDHGAHLRAAIEWWYLTGELRDDAGGAFGFQITFFRSRTGLAEDLPSRFAPRQLLFAHAALTDLGAQRHAHAQRVARWSGDVEATLARAAVPDTDLRIGDWTLRRTDAAGRSRYRTRFGTDRTGVPDSFELRLQLDAAQPPLLQGDAGFSRKGPEERQASHYVSEPQLQAGGELDRGGRAVAVRGRAWLDHEWADALMHPDAVGWDWIGMNLDDGGALTAFRLRRADGSALWAGGSLRTGDGRLQTFAADAVRFAPGRLWASPATGARYPLQWRVETPAGRFEVRALLEAQELDSRGNTGTVYWEGLSELLDAAGRRVGSGYLEMTGYAGRLALK
jgi:predicted secreted hydrolase